MTRIADEGPNAEQIRYWNEQAGPRWVAAADRLDAYLEPLGRVAMERGGIAAGHRVLDVGCGCGHTTLAIGTCVGAGGGATGVDLSAEMLERARQRARDAGAANVRFENADAQTAELGAASYDVVYSRFGVMFFADPVAAFANLRRALAPGGRVAFVCWQAVSKNPWVLQPLTAAAKHVPLPEPPGPGQPGPFSFADPDRVRGLLRDAGFARVECEDVEMPLTLAAAGDVDEATRFLLEIGPTSRLVQEVDDATRAAVGDSVREVLEAHSTPEGVRLGAAVWVVVAGE